MKIAKYKLTEKLLKCNFNVGRESDIKEITIHHCAGDIKLNNLFTLFNNPAKQVSSHYGVKDNEVFRMVKESNTAWTNSDRKANHRAITIEVSNNTNKPPWGFTKSSIETLIELIYDIAKRNRLLPLIKGVNLTWHKMYKNTDCPSQYIIDNLDKIISEVNKIMYEEQTFFRVMKDPKKPDTTEGICKKISEAMKLCDKLNQGYAVYDYKNNKIYPN